MKDGDIDYSRFSPSELQEALEGINPKAFPKNYENLKVAYSMAFPKLEVAQKEVTKSQSSKDPAREKKAAWDFYYSSQAAIGSVAGSGAFLSNPDAYLYALVTIPVAFITYFTLKNRKSKVLYVQCFSGVSLYSFLIGRFFYESHRLTTVGLLAMLVVLGVTIVLFVMLRTYENEAET